MLVHRFTFCQKILTESPHSVPVYKSFRSSFSTTSWLLSLRSCLSARSTKMSWMDSWSRPIKSQMVPAPYYLIPGGEETPYCRSCGRVIGTRRTANAGQASGNKTTPVKYCSSRCRSHKPGKLDREIESAFVKLLLGQQEKSAEGPSVDKANDAKSRNPTKSTKGYKHSRKKSKGDQRILVPCSAVEKIVFKHHEQDHDTEESRSGSEGEHDSNDTERIQPTTNSYDDNHLGDSQEDQEAGTMPHIDGDVLARMSVRSGTRKRPPQSVSEVNGSVGGEKGRAERIEETDEMLEKRRQGQRRAKEREMVRCAARRGVVFGFQLSPDDITGMGDLAKTKDQEEKVKCEAVMSGKVVEPSFTKGNWSIRWRE